MLTQRRIDYKAVKARHVNQVHRAKQIIADAAADLIWRQFRDAAQELRQSSLPKRSAIFQPRQWDQRLKGAVGPAIARVMLTGAASELRRHGRLRRSKSTASDYLAENGIDLSDTDFASELPLSLIDSIEAALVDSFKRSYWEAINGTTANQIEGILRHGIVEGLSIRDM